jgi:hypothetical protein
MKDSIVEEVRKDLLDRSELGIKKYNTTLDRTDLMAADWVQHAYEECLDMALYLKRLKKEIFELEKSEWIYSKKIDLLNQVIKNQEQEIDELKKGIHVEKKRRGWHY